MADIVPDQDRLEDEPLAEGELASGELVILRRASLSDVPAMLSVMHTAFAARPPLGAKPAALAETVESLTEALEAGAGFLTLVDGEPVATMIVSRVDGVLRLSRVAVHPSFQRHGIATFSVSSLLEVLAESGEESVTLLSRREYPQLEKWWTRHGFTRADVEDDCWVLSRTLPVIVEVPTADDMRDLGRRLAALVRPGDLITATGDLGAGKTTLAQGLAAGMGVTGPVISPTFVLSRVHRSPAGGPALVHVDAYRLSSAAELEDIDLEESLADSVTLVEWGQGVADSLNPDRLEIEIRRGDDPVDETRWVYCTPVGSRWDRESLDTALGREWE